MECQAGDWVAFYQQGRVVIGRVLYRHKSKLYPYEWALATDVGSIDEQYVLERRPLAESAVRV
jgi:hypothetical protein